MLSKISIFYFHNQKTKADEIKVKMMGRQNPYLGRSHFRNSPTSHPSTKPSESGPDTPIPLKWSILTPPQTSPTPEITGMYEIIHAQELPYWKVPFTFSKGYIMRPWGEQGLSDRHKETPHSLPSNHMDCDLQIGTDWAPNTRMTENTSATVW